MNFSPIAITGPTACGKTAAALALAEHLPIEIISVDSALIYTRMDIGTAKPTLAELAKVPHHLINIREPYQSYSVAEFAKDCEKLCKAIRVRGKQAVLVGGTMLYLKSLMLSLDAMPSVSPEVRQNILTQANEIGWPALHQQLQIIDPITAARLNPNDGQRIGRALEIYVASGQTLSSLQKQNQANNTSNSRKYLLAEDNIISLEPMNRADLHNKINQRFAIMQKNGFWSEMKALYQDPQLSLDLPSMRCIGYRQAWELFDQYRALGQNPFDLSTMEQKKLSDKWHELGSAATRQLAKRQLTWLRSMPQRQVIASDHPNATALVVQKALGMMKV